MAYKSDIEIAQECTMAPITEVAAKAGIDDRYLEQYGKYKAKINYSLLKESEAPDGKLVLVTAINPTPAGEGKTTTTVGLADGLRKIGKNPWPPCVVAVNAFPTDTKAELDLVEQECRKLGVNAALSQVWAKGGEGGIALAEEVVRLCEEDHSGFTFSYELEGSIQDKLDQIVRKIYGGSGAVLTASARKQAEQLEALGYGSCPICVAKTQYSLSDDPGKLGAPGDFPVTVRNLKISAGAGFIVALTGEIMTMPGLPKSPAAESIDIDSTGRISGLF